LPSNCHPKNSPGTPFLYWNLSKATTLPLRSTILPLGAGITISRILLPIAKFR